MRVTQRKRAFAIKPLYRVAELALMVGMSRFALLRLLRSHGVETGGGGKAPRTVTLVALSRGIPGFWESIVLARSLDR